MAETRKLKKPIEELRADLLADERTQRYAKTLNLPLEEYVEKVLDYAQHPEKEPVFNIVPEAQVKAQGGATIGEVQTWLKKAISGEIQLGPKGYTDGFEPAKPSGPKKS
jgi:hypothetical protein